MYQIYPRSFRDSGGDGIGDLEGIRQRLDYLAWLGVDAVWLSPCYPSPMRDFGYDVADYCDVDPIFGTLGDFDRLLADAHARGIRLLIDWVPNHTSDRHPWFVESRVSRRSAKRDWYIWRDGSPDRPPNNWRAAFSDTPAWTWDPATEQWYLHLFLPEQPDLNWTNPEVVGAMHATLRFWLDRGVDGVRIDVVHCLGKDAALADNPPETAAFSKSIINDEPSTHAIIRDLRRVLDAYPGERMMVGEVYLLSTEQVARYYGNGDELHLAFNFAPLYAPWAAGAWRGEIERVSAVLEPRGAWPSWVLSNHDIVRHRTRYGGGEARARAAAVLLLTLRGTPFLYAGEELGLEQAEIPPGRIVDPGGRDGCRTPIPWSSESGHGWTGAEPWLPFGPEPETRNVESLRRDPASIVHLYRRLLAARRASPALRLGDWRAIEAPDDVLAYLRTHGDDRRAVIINFGTAQRSMPLAGTWQVEVASDGEGDGADYRGVIAGERAVVLRTK